MLATALAVCACHQGRRVRFTTLAGLANELQEAQSTPRARPRRRPLRPHRARRPRRARLPRAARRRRRARLPSPLRAPRTRLADRHHQPAVRRVDEGLPRPPARQGRRRPPHPPRAHHRHRHRVLALPPRPPQQGQPTPRQMTRARATAAPASRLRATAPRQQLASITTTASGKINTRQQPTPGGATSSHRAGASASHRFHGPEPEQQPQAPFSCHDDHERQGETPATWQRSRPGAPLGAPARC